MLSEIDMQAMIQAAMNRMQINFTYLKATTGETVQHVGGIVEIRASEGCVFIWDTSLNDHIRKFLLPNFESFQVLQQPFDNLSAGGYPLVINGQIMPEPSALTTPVSSTQG